MERTDVDYFVPGMIYGSSAHLTEVAIGRIDTYRTGGGVVRIREDRLLAPMFAVSLCTLR